MRKFKGFSRALPFFLSPILLNVKASAENTSGNTINEAEFADVLVSFLYFAGVLVLIYIILLLVNKWGKKHPDKETKEENKNTSPENEEGDAPQEKNTKDTGEEK
ncbi:MAG: hypothetical protein NC203_05825 [Firmicutes bacterium]|nr:hypothetical protein [[Eubacterium] siraeum]MCM1487868.1 hypothetical protein [Bacillota bacterium]